jgi:nucleotide-binding universal stress UspA family protein
MIPAAIPEIKKILYATDLSENARYAFGYAMSLANQYGAGITILHVLESSSSSESLVTNVIGEKRWNELRKENEQEVVKTIKKRLENFCEEVTREVPECPFITDEIIVRIGIPADEILNLVGSRDYDLVVMGAHGHGILGSAIMGSISRRVVRHSKRPVLVIRLPSED